MNQNENYTKSSENPELDAMRVFAFILVFFAHFPLDIRPLEFLGRDLTTNFLKMWIGVDVFFVLSGFLLTRQLVLKIKNETPNVYKKFILRRIFRTWPAYYGVIFLIIILLEIFPGFSKVWVIPEAALNFKSIMGEVFYISNYVGTSVLSIAWSLCIEEHFYVLLPLTLFIFLKTKSYQKSLCFFGISVILAGIFIRYNIFQSNLNLIGDYESFDSLFYKKTHTHLDGLVMGSLLGMLEATSVKWKKLQGKLQPIYWVLFISSSLYLYKFSFRAVEFHSSILVFTVAGLWSSCFLLIGRYNITVQKLCSIKLFTWLSERTYSFYLTHILAAVATKSIFVNFPEFYIKGWGGFLTITPTYFLLTLLFSEVLFICIEKPFLKLRNKYASW